MKFPFILRKKAAARLRQQEAKSARLKEEMRTLKSEQKAELKELRRRVPNLSKYPCDLRRLIATALTGEGIEIGALHFPLPVPEGVTVKYVDMSTREENICRYPNLDANAIVETHYVCNGETLEVISDESQDFVIANHMLEHCINPLGTLATFLRVLRPGGLLFLTLPDKRFTFDIDRPITPFSHIEDDFRINRVVEDLAAYEDWTTNVRKSGDPVQLHKDQKNIHFHAWTQAEILEMFIEARRRLGMPLEIEWAAKNEGEFIVLLRKYNGEPDEIVAARRSAEELNRS